MRCVSSRGKRLDQFLREEPGLAARLRAFEKICEAVAFAHDRGVVHCDLKPQNVMTGGFGEVFVMDWESRIHGAGGGNAAVPMSGAGADRAIGPVLAGEMLEEFGPLPRPLASVAERAAAADPAARYGSAQELAADVARFLDGLPVSAHRESVRERAGRFARKNQVLLLLLATYLVVKFALIFLFGR